MTAAKARRVLPDTVIWWPLAMGLGIAGFFLLPNDPPLILGPILAALAFAVFRFVKHEWRIAPFMLLLFAVGFSLIQFRTWSMEEQRWTGGDRSVSFTATVEDVTPVAKGVRLLLRDVAIEKPAISLKKIRVTCKSCTADSAAIGSRVAGRGQLSSPEGPAREGGFDFRRVAFYRGIAATGFLYGAPDIVEGAKPDPNDFFRQARHRLANIVETHIANEDTRALGTALLTGVQTSLPDKLREAYQVSGLAHIYSISGLHLGFVAGFLFFLFRGAFALTPLALRWPVKKIAAGMALVAIVAFTLFTGDSVPTWRSLIMASVVLIAVMTDRFAFTLRVVALAAIAILIVMPEMILDISFQLSFAAVAALVAWMEWMERPSSHIPRSRLYRILRDVIVTTLLASIATLPFILHSFGRLPAYSIVSNAIGIPFTGFVIMPLVLLTLILFMFGLAPLGLILLAPFLDLLNGWAYEVASWPYAGLRVPVIPGWVVVICALSLYAACAHPRRWTAGVLLASYLILGFFAFKPAPKPVLYASQDGLVAFKEGDTLWVSSTTKDKFDRAQWAADWGIEDKTPVKLPMEGAVGAIGHCNRDACSVTLNEKRVHILRSAVAAPEACADKDAFVIAPDVRIGNCAAAKADRNDLFFNGAYALKEEKLKPVGGKARRVWQKN